MGRQLLNYGVLTYVLINQYLAYLAKTENLKGLPLLAQSMLMFRHIPYKYIHQVEHLDFCRDSDQCCSLPQAIHRCDKS